jgi:hypothetical protein
MLAATTFVEQTASAFYFAGNRAAVKVSVTGPQAHSASRLIEMERYIAGVGGRAAGPILLSVAWLPFAANAASYAVNLGILSRTRNEFPVREQESSPTFAGMFPAVREGLRVIWDDATLRRVTVGAALTNAAFAALGVRTAAVVADMPGWVAGVTLGGTALGGVAGAILPRALTERGIGSLYPGALTAYAGLGLSMALSTNPFVLGAAGFGIATVGVGLNVSTTAYQIQAIPGEVYGSASSAKNLIAGSGVAGGGLLGGYLLAAFGVGTSGWIEVAALGAVAAGSLLTSTLPRLRNHFR